MGFLINVISTEGRNELRAMEQSERRFNLGSNLILIEILMIALEFSQSALLNRDGVMIIRLSEQAFVRRL